MSLWNKLRTGLSMADMCISAIEVIGGLVGASKGVDHTSPPSKVETALNTLETIGTIVSRVKDVLSGKEDPAKAKADFEKMKSDIAQNNADVDAAIDEKFGTGTD